MKTCMRGGLTGLFPVHRDNCYKVRCFDYNSCLIRIMSLGILGFLVEKIYHWMPSWNPEMILSLSQFWEDIIILSIPWKLEVDFIRHVSFKNFNAQNMTVISGNSTFFLFHLRWKILARHMCCNTGESVGSCWAWFWARIEWILLILTILKPNYNLEVELNAMDENYLMTSLIN